MVTIPGYQIKKQIYKCETYAVYRGFREEDNQPVILKMLRAEDPSVAVLEQCQHEFNVLRSLDGEGIVRALDLITDQKKNVLIYEDIGAESLDNLMEKMTFSMTERLVLAVGLTAAVGQVHHAGFIHKRINPTNIFYHPATGRVQLINFELATELISDQIYSDGSEVSLKTMAYIAPEQTGKMSRPLGFRSDLYSLGATLYKFFTGKQIFEGGDLLEFVHSHIAIKPVSPHQADPQFPSTLSDVIMKLLAKEAEDRYRCAAGLKHDLNVCLDQHKKTGRIHLFTLQERDISDQFRISNKLYGRNEEIGVLKTAFARAQNGSLEHVYVTGYAGIGKTALVREALQQIITEAKTTIHLGIGRFDRFHRDVPYSAIVQSARDVVRQILVQSDEEVEKWRKKLARALGPNGRVISDIIPELEVILGPQPAAPRLGPLEAQNRLNLVFQNFVRTFAGPSHPLVIFLDDVQWADAASLKLIETLLTDDGLHHFLGIAAYRDDEIGSDHPIHATLDALKNKKVRLTSLRLSSLGLGSVKSLIADSIYTDKNRVSDLGALTLQKTDGNPFFMKVFLETLHSEQLLVFDSDRAQWQWSISRINQLEITDNVVDLLVQKFQRLTKNTREILKTACSVGIEFDSSVLCAVLNRIPGDMDTLLKKAVTEGVIVPDDLVCQEKNGDISPSQKPDCTHYRFAHDRIRQAVYASMTTQEKWHCHSRIGLYLLGNLSDAEKEEQIFAVANHLNAGGDQITSALEEDELARLNLDAGLKAKTAAAFFPAFNYFQHGIRMLGINRWEDRYDLTKTFYEMAAETAYLCGYYDEMDRLAGEVMERAHSFLDTINIYETIINSHIARYQLEKAITTAIDVLRKLNVSLPDKASKWKLFKGYMGAKSTLAWKEVESLAKIKKMKDPTRLAAIKILACAGSAAYFSNQDLLALFTFKAVQLSTKYGNAPESAIPYASYGLILCSVMDDIDAGFQFGELSLQILKQFNLKQLESRVVFLVNTFIRHWKNHIRETLSPLEDVYQTGLETGDFEYAGYGALWFSYHSFVAGIELPEVERRYSKYSTAIRRLKHEFAYQYQEMVRQAISNLKDEVDDPCRLSGKYYDETRQLSIAREAMDKATLSSVYLMKLYLNYLFCNYSKAAKYAELTLTNKDGFIGSVNIQLLYFYDSLTHLALYPDAEVHEKNKILKKVADNQKKMKHWAKHAPMNHQHKYGLVEAERLAVKGSKNEAEKYYQESTELAIKHGYRNEEALILERTAIFYARTGENQLAADTMLKARSAYEKWGAMAKVRTIDKEFAFLLIDRHPQNQKDVSVDGLDENRSRTEKDLNMAAVMKATQAISSEIVFEKLLDQLMRIIIENAGAQKGFLILNKEGRLWIEASVAAGSDEVDAYQSLPVEESDELSIDIVRYVERTGDPVVIHKATEDDQFYTDLHVLENRPKSILCMPILQKEKTAGVLYLENNLTSNVFTKERIKILNILLAQAAISLDNALLYENLKKEVAVRKQAEEKMLHLATAVEQAAEGIVIGEDGGKIRYVNSAFENITGYSSGELIGLNIKDFNPVTKDEAIFKNMWRTVASEKNWSGHVRFQKKEGSLRDLDVIVSPIRHDTDSPNSYVGVLRDTTHEIQMEKELRQAQKMEAMGTLAGGIAHDFNNILAAIMGYTELATFQSAPESPVHQNLERVITATKRAKDLVRQILAFSRQADQEARPIQLQVFIKEALKMLRASLPSTIEIRREIKDVSSYVEADPTQIHQVMMNLCTNAAQAMETGGVLTVCLEDYTVDEKNHHRYPEVTPGHFLRLIVRDTGEGINKKIIERIFEPFFSTKDPGKGTGMGLAMVHGIVKRYEGAIRVESEPGRGAEFRILFPVYEGGLIQEEKPGDNHVLPGKERVLFVDDEKALVTLAEEGLQRIGYQVHKETDSREALKVFKQNPEKFDLIVTDQTMPNLTGIELSKELIQIRPDIPIILYSGVMNEISSEMIEAVGIRAFLSKPLMLKQLSEAIRRVLDNPAEVIAG